MMAEHVVQQKQTTKR